jgi:hypothetical protein
MYVKCTAHHQVVKRTREILSEIPARAWKKIDPQLLVYDILAHAVRLDEESLLEALGPEIYAKAVGSQPISVCQKQSVSAKAK